ncbi:alkaline phosphatase family protein [Kribbella qitaiheensis]|uniref:Alkaline phosphatase family protein n=1 Tax=Kribbella qitaiheensis TaxID=1544730 RepID=A0A7G6X679_9ACTN|nr:nucleotide pyrophosphatase/phosphodiesterase family protein [Kribbella qitaiheensis]QNE21744.1 alkaline phosphatase family protein [Kribbella qitaiheensis]
MTQQVLVIDVVGRTPRLLRKMPRLRSLPLSRTLGAVLPAVTCSAQATFLTGKLPSDHGIVGNGWYFRDLGDVFLWRQHNQLVQGEKIWDVARRSNPQYKVANVCWWYAMGAETDLLVTPRPIYYADGRKAPDCYTRPVELHDRLTKDLGAFPLFNYWGPTASIKSSKWIVAASRKILAEDDPDLLLTYVPHLDYDLQRYGASSVEATRAAIELDAVLAPLLDDAEARGATVIVLSEYGITDVDRPVDINRVLRSEGLVEVHTQDGMEYLDPWTSRAFAVADHQIARVYVKDPVDIDAVSKLLQRVAGVAEVLDADGKKEQGLDHERAGELVAVAEADSWFTYYYWLDDERAPDFARAVEIHRKPGYDPAELFFDPSDRFVKPRAASYLLRKKVGLRYAMQVVPLDPSIVRGSHGRLPASDEDGPVFLSSDPTLVPEGQIAPTAVRDLVLKASKLIPE